MFCLEEPYGDLHNSYQLHGTRYKNNQRPLPSDSGLTSINESQWGKIDSVYLTLGAQDAVVVFELPDDETAVSRALARAGLGNLRTTSMRAFTEAEVPGVLSKLP